MQFSILLISLFLPASTLAYTNGNPSGRPVIVPNSKSVALPPSLLTGNHQDLLVPTMNEQEDVVLGESASASAGRVRKSKWGVDNAHSEEYWFDNRIHTLGNSGFMGAFHAAVAPVSTKIIDLAAYKGVDIRTKLAHDLAKTVGKNKAKIVDLCCGVGCSTRALKNAFPNGSVVGIDTSPEMVAMAEFISKHVEMVKPLFGRAAPAMSESYLAMKKKGYALKKAALCKAVQFRQQNAEDTKLPAGKYDLVTIMYAFHEAPMSGRDAILKEARRLLSPGGTLAVVDISTDYEPTENMLKGEPYVQEYQKHIHGQLENFEGFEGSSYSTIVDNHLGMWTLKRSAAFA